MSLNNCQKIIHRILRVCYNERQDLVWILIRIYSQFGYNYFQCLILSPLRPHMREVMWCAPEALCYRDAMWLYWSGLSAMQKTQKKGAFLSDERGVIWVVFKSNRFFYIFLSSPVYWFLYITTHGHIWFLMSLLLCLYKCVCV